MNTYVILRRGGWADAEELEAVGARSNETASAMSEDILWLRSYIVAESDGRLGSVCIYRATSEEAIRRHATTADLPCDEIIPVADIVVVNPDPT
jgi:hypothetical protein